LGDRKGIRPVKKLDIGLFVCLFVCLFDRARRAHRKRCHSFFDPIHSFSARGQNVDFWLLSKNNTGSLPLCGNPAVIK